MTEKLLWYWSEYSSLLLLSLPYFAALPLAGYFIILRRSLFFGLTLTNLAQCSFVLGFSLFSLFHENAFELINLQSQSSQNGQSAAATEATETTLLGELLKLDIYVWPIFIGGLFALLLLIGKSDSRLRHTDLRLAVVFIVLSGITHISHKLFGATDLVISRSYFTEILYTHPDLLRYYSCFMLPLVFMLLLFFQRFLALSFDETQATLTGIPIRPYTILLYLLLGALIAVHLRVLGFYLSLAVLFIPAHLALSLFRQVFSSLLFSSLFSILFAVTGFGIAFIWDDLPTEPLLIASFGLQSALLFSIAHLGRWMRR